MNADKPVRLIILGAGGNSPAIADAVLAINSRRPDRPAYELVGFLDDLPENRSRTVMGFPVVGTIDEAVKWTGCRFINGIASTKSFRLKPDLIARSGVPLDRFESIVHPQAIIARDAHVGRGTAIMAGSVVCTGASVGDHVIMLQNSTLNHDSALADYVTVSAGVTILGSVRIGRVAFIGGGASIAPYANVGEASLIGMGSVVIRDVPAGQVVAGNPARQLKASRFGVGS